MYDKSLLRSEDRYGLDKAEFDDQLNFTLEAANEIEWEQPIGRKRNWMELAKFFISDYFAYTGNRFSNSISRVINFWNSRGFRQDKVLRDYFVRTKINAKTRNLRRLLFFLGIEQDTAKRNRAIKNVKRSGFLSFGQRNLSFGAGPLSKGATIYPDLKKDLVVTRPEQLWIADITEMTTREGQKYFYIITDAHSNQVVGYSISEKLAYSEAINALKMALGKRKYYESLIHHSQDGIHYCLHHYKQLLKESNILMSASEF